MDVSKLIKTDPMWRQDFICKRVYKFSKFTKQLAYLLTI